MSLIDRKLVYYKIQLYRRWTSFELKQFLSQYINQGDCVMVHSSMHNLHVDCIPSTIVQILLDLVGFEGTLVFPVFPRETSYEFCKNNLTYTKSGMGIISETARLWPTAFRSQHLTKSVVAIGKYASFLTNEHNRVAFDRTSPFYKLISLNAKLLGLGVWSYNCSFVHVVDDTCMNFPINPYHKEFFGLAHDPSKAKLTENTHHFMKKYIDKKIFKDFTYCGRRFFFGYTALLYKEMCQLANKGTTIYVCNNNN